MKILLIGPYPPPHGGISVHVMEARHQLERTGAQVKVLNTNRGATADSEYLRFRTLPGLISILARYSLQGWMLHVHTNGHNTKSWILASLCGLIGRLGRGCLLTLHSGMTASYLQDSAVNRLTARRVCGLFDRVVAVNAEIYNVLVDAGIPSSSLELLPAYLSTPATATIPDTIQAFMRSHWPVFSTVLFFRPEYGVEFLLKSLALLRKTYPNLGCLLLGSAENSIAARSTIRAEGLDDSILLAGDVSHELCLALISKSDVFVRCTFADGDSISVREAINAGVPVVASAVGHRPPGALLFPAGDVVAFAAQVESALSNQRPRLADEAPDLSSVRLIEMYRKLQPEKIGT